MTSLDHSVFELISLLDSSVKEQAIEYLASTPFHELQTETKDQLYEALLEKNCYEPLYNLSLDYAPQNMDTLISHCVESNDACKILMNLTRVFEPINMQLFMHSQFENLLSSGHEYMFGVLVNMSKFKETHATILQHLPSCDSSNPFVVRVLKNLSFDSDTHESILDLLPEYLERIVSIGFHDSIISDERAMEEYEKDEISGFVFTTKEIELTEPPLEMIELIIIMLNGTVSTRQQLSHLGIYYIVRHLDLKATEMGWNDLNQAIINCVELLLARDEFKKEE